MIESIQFRVKYALESQGRDVGQDPKIPAKAIAQWLKKTRTLIITMRIDRDLSQAQFAKVLGWSRGKLANIEAGRSKLTQEDFAVIAYGFGLTPETFIERISKISEW